MRNEIRHKIITTTIIGYRIIDDLNEPKIENLEPISVFGKLRESECLSLLKRHYNSKNARIARIETTSKTYVMDIEEFVSLAKIEPENKN